MSGLDVLLFFSYSPSSIVCSKLFCRQYITKRTSFLLKLCDANAKAKCPAKAYVKGWQ